MRRFLVCAALAALGWFHVEPGLAESSITTTNPVQGVPYNAAPIRQNFQAAANDINALQSMNAGASAPASPELGTLWLETPQNETQYPLHIWNDRLSQWVQIATLDSLNNLWITNIGGGLTTALLAADTVDLGTEPNAVIEVTGSGPIFSFGTSAPAGTIKIVRFTGVTTVTYNATSLITPGAANITTAANDIMIAVAEGSGNWRVLFLQQAALSVAQGGTGRTTLTDHAVLLGSGTDPIDFAVPGTSGYVLTSNGAAADPSFQQPNLSGVTGVLAVANGGTGQSALTDHYVLIGNGTDPVTLVAPSATSGVPLISQGSSLDPIFGTVVVAGGGTGQTSLTQYAVLLGNGTGAVAFASPGTSGYALLSTGASSNPAFGQLGLAGLATIANNTVLGNVSGGVASPSALTGTQMTTLCQIYTYTLSGCVPASVSGTTTFLRADGVWAIPAGTAIPNANLLGGDGSAFTSVTVSTGLQLAAGNLTAPQFASGSAGIVPASGGGTTNFLRADGTWTAPPGSSTFGTPCTVTSANPATCNGLAGKVVFTSLDGGGGGTITNSSVAATSIVVCTANVETAGVPEPVSCEPTSGAILASFGGSPAPTTGTVSFLVVNP